MPCSLADVVVMGHPSGFQHGSDPMGPAASGFSTVIGQLRRLRPAVGAPEAKELLKFCLPMICPPIG